MKQLRLLIIVSLLLISCKGRRCEFELTDGSIVEAKDCMVAPRFRTQPVCKDRTFSLYKIKSWRCE